MGLSADMWDSVEKESLQKVGVKGRRLGVFSRFKSGTWVVLRTNI